MNLEHYYNIDDLSNDYFSNFERKFGQIQMKKISDKVNSSNAVERLIQDSINAHELPNQTTLSVVLLGSRYFMFANPETLNCACFLTLNKAINAFKSNDLHVSDERALEISKRIIFARN